MSHRSTIANTRVSIKKVRNWGLNKKQPILDFSRESLTWIKEVKRHEGISLKNYKLKLV